MKIDFNHPGYIHAAREIDAEKNTISSINTTRNYLINAGFDLENPGQLHDVFNNLCDAATLILNGNRDDFLDIIDPTQITGVEVLIDAETALDFIARQIQHGDNIPVYVVMRNLITQDVIAIQQFSIYTNTKQIRPSFDITSYMMRFESKHGLEARTESGPRLRTNDWPALVRALYIRAMLDYLTSC